MTACPFAESLGKPGEGIHSVRLGGLAVVDVAATLLGAWLLAPRLGMPTWAAFLALVCLGVLVVLVALVDMVELTTTLAVMAVIVMVLQDLLAVDLAEVLEELVHMELMV
jgi:predicted membrane-bound spermidine synthase